MCTLKAHTGKMAHIRTSFFRRSIFKLTCCPNLPRLNNLCRGNSTSFRFLTHTTTLNQSRTFSRHATPVKESLSTNLDLYDEVFRPFGVSTQQFNTLMSHGVKCRAAPGSVIVPGGEFHTKLVLMLRGTAVAYTRDETESKERTAVCQYVGRLACNRNLEQKQGSASLATRGSVIGGSALVDESITLHPYPFDVVASVPTEWVEWDLKELNEIINAQFWRAVQASVYHLLYVELISTLDRERALQIQLHDVQKHIKEDKEATTPTPKQLFSLTCFVAVPFFGFGLADNGIMIVCGDLIDAKFGAVLGLTTLASAGLGNWVSDVVGLGIGDAIERQATRLGLSNGGLTAAQEKMQISKFVTLAAKIIGITLGCFAGMTPLLFLTPHKIEIVDDDIQVFDEIFRPSGLSTSQFAELMKYGSRRRAQSGQVLVQGGTEYKKVMLLLHGQVEAFAQSTNSDGRGRAVCSYIGRLDVKTAGLPASSTKDVPSRGSIIGGSAIANQSAASKPYPFDIVAVRPVEFIEWGLEDLLKLMADEVAIQGCFSSILYGEILTTLQSDNKSKQYNHYRLLLQAVLADGVVAEKERDFIETYRRDHNISEQDHLHALQELGWTFDGWNRGFQPASSQMTLKEPQPEHLRYSSEQLEQAILLIRQVLDTTKTEQVGATYG